MLQYISTAFQCTFILLLMLLFVRDEIIWCANSRWDGEVFKKLPLRSDGLTVSFLPGGKLRSGLSLKKWVGNPPNTVALNHRHKEGKGTGHSLTQQQHPKMAPKGKIFFEYSVNLWIHKHLWCVEMLWKKQFWFILDINDQICDIPRTKIIPS